MRDDPLERLAVLRDRAEGLVSRLAGTGVEANYTGVDEAGVVSVRLGADGRVAEVTVAAHWRSVVGVGELSTAVRQAVQVASVRRLRAWGESFTTAAEPAASRTAGGSPPRQDDPLPMELDGVATARMDSGQGAAGLRELLALIEAVEAGIDQVSAELRDNAARVFTARSGAGEVTVTVTADATITDLRYDRRWLRETTAASIGRETSRILREAYQRADDKGVAQVVAGSPLGQVHAAGQDPFGLARRLRLTDTGSTKLMGVG